MKKSARNKRKLKDKLKNKKELEEALKGLEDSLKIKRGQEKALQEAKQKFEGFRSQVQSATGETAGQRAGNQRGGGQQAWQCAKEFGLTISSSNSADTSDMSKGIIDGALKQIEEELKKVENKKNNRSGFISMKFKKQDFLLVLFFLFIDVLNKKNRIDININVKPALKLNI